MEATRAVKLFGTEEPAGEMRRLKAGALEAMLDGGNLRYIRIDGVEALRGIAFLVRDRDWGTYNAEIEGLRVEEDARGFRVAYEARCRDAEQSLRYAARIEGRPDGSLVFEADGEAETDFTTNRTGFVVLHPLTGVVDRPVRVEHTDGRVEESRFPVHVDPACPFQDIRALTHEIAPGVSLTCRMEGDAFEMEDHRNWMDASFKTYVRPLAKPWPYVIEKGEKLEQRVTLALSGEATDAREAGADVVSVELGGPTGTTMPRLGLAAPAEHVSGALDRAALLRDAGPGFLVCHFDPRAGHDAGTVAGYKALGDALEAPLVLEAVVPCLDDAGRPTSDLAIMRRDMAAIADAAGSAVFERVAVSPATDLKCTLPGSRFPPAPSWEELIACAREAFPGVPVGGGMFSYFTELNRKRPPQGLLDFICHSGAPIVHAGDDVSVTETLEALPSIFASVHAFAGDTPYWVFPTAVSMRMNPYGAEPAENPDNVRQAMNRVDPRDRSLLGAAWYAGYVAEAARAGVDAVTLAAVAGPSGIVSTRQDHPRPWFDDADAAVMPSYHAFALHAALAGLAVLEARSSRPQAVQALAVEGPDGPVLVLTNLTGTPVDVDLGDMGDTPSARILDEASFETFAKDPRSLPGQPVEARILRLAPYAMAELRGGDFGARC